MKKLSILAFIGIVGLLSVMSSCKKETAVTPTPSYNYDNTDVKTMIKLSNKDLYNRMYGGGKEPSTIIYVEHGYNQPPTFDDCEENPAAICGIVIIVNHDIVAPDSTVTTTSTTASSAVVSIDGIDYTYNAANKGDAILVIAKPDAPKSYDIKNLSIKSIDGVGTKEFTYEIYP